MRFAADRAGYFTAHIGGYLLGWPSIRSIFVAKNGVATATTRARNRLNHLPFRALSCSDACIRLIEVLLSGMRVRDHALIQIVRCPWPAGFRARASRLCARPPAVGLRRCAA